MARDAEILEEIRDIKTVQTKMLCSLAKIEEHLVSSDAVLHSHGVYIEKARENDLAQWKYIIAVAAGSATMGGIGGALAQNIHP